MKKFVHLHPRAGAQVAENLKRSPRRDQGVAPAEPTKVEKVVLPATRGDMIMGRNVYSLQPEAAWAETTDETILIRHRK